MPIYTFYTNYGNRTVEAGDATCARSIVRNMLSDESYNENKEAPVAWDIYLIASKLQKPKNVDVRARVKPEIVTEVNKVLEGTGRTKSDIIRALFEQIASEKKLPDWLTGKSYGDSILGDIVNDIKKDLSQEGVKKPKSIFDINFDEIRDTVLENEARHKAEIEKRVKKYRD